MNPSTKILVLNNFFNDFIKSISGSRRPSLASVHSTSSSVRSYSMVRFEKELQQRELRNEMKLRLSKLQTQNRPIINIIDTVGMTSRSLLPSPSPITPNSTDELLPIVDEGLEVSSILNQSIMESYLD